MRLIDQTLVGWATVKIYEALAKGARKGRHGWDDPYVCSNAKLIEMAQEHVERGPDQFVDAAVLLLMAAFRHDRKQR